MITEEQVTLFQELYRKRFGKDISREMALESGLKLLRLMKILVEHKTMSQAKK